MSIKEQIPVALQEAGVDAWSLKHVEYMLEASDTAPGAKLIVHKSQVITQICDYLATIMDDHQGFLFRIRNGAQTILEHQDTVKAIPGMVQGSDEASLRANISGEIHHFPTNAILIATPADHSEQLIPIKAILFLDMNRTRPTRKWTIDKERDISRLFRRFTDGNREEHQALLRRLPTLHGSRDVIAAMMESITHARS